MVVMVEVGVMVDLCRLAPTASQLATCVVGDDALVACSRLYIL